MILSLLDTPTKINIPESFIGWTGLVLFLLAFIFSIIHWWEIPISSIQRRWTLLLFLFLLIIPANLFLGVGDTPFENDSIFGGLVPGMLSSAIPWLLISGFFGPVIGGLAGLMSGLFQSFWLTNSIYTPMITAISAVIAGVSFRQKYRGSIYSVMRHPAGAAAAAGISAYLLTSLAAFFESSLSLAGRLDLAMTSWRANLLAIMLPLVVAGLVGEFFFYQKLGPWKKVRPFVPSPDEGFSESKFWRISLPVCFLFIFLFSQAVWSIQTRHINHFLKDSISSHAELAAGYWVQEEEKLLAVAEDFSTPELFLISPLDFFITAQKTFDEENLHITLVDSKGIVIQRYPDATSTPKYSADVIGAIRAGLQSNVTSVISFQSGMNSTELNLVVIQPVAFGEEGKNGVVVLQYGLAPRSMKSSFWAEIQKLEDLGATVWIEPAEDAGLRLEGISTADIQSRVFPGEYLTYSEPESSTFYAYWPSNQEWNIFVSVPTTAASENLLPEFFKQVLLLIIGFTILLLLLNLYWLNLFKDEQRLLLASRQISRGDYVIPPGIQDVTELSELGHAIDQIRVNVKSQMDEAYRLISIGRGVAFREEFGIAVEPILRAALRGDAACARVILVPADIERVVQTSIRRFGEGERSDAYAVLDTQILEICQKEGIFVIRNTARSRRIDLNNAVTVPASIAALPVYLDKDDFLGVFWVGYERSQVFPDEEIAHLKTLASEIAVAAAGERRISETELGKKQFESLVSAIQDPLLLINEEGVVLFANAAAISINGLIIRDENGNRKAIPDIQRIIPDDSHEISDEGLIQEILLSNGRNYSARVTKLETDGYLNGLLCVLRDINSYSEMIARKGEFVETVSHDLRQPLTLISGYATMVQMVGSVNDQQRGYLDKITNDLESLKKMVNNILDLGRIETETRLFKSGIHPEELVTKVIDEFSLQAQQKKITLSDLTNPENDPIELEADGGLLYQALYNIVENAIKFSNIDGRVDVWVEKLDNMCVFHVKDNGIGISPIDLPGIFAKSSRSSARESGQYSPKMGLAIVKSIIEQHGGNVTVESQLGKGSHFRIEIPI